MAKTGNPYIQGSDVGGVQDGGLLKMSLVSGAASAADIAVTGMKLEDTIVWVHNMTDLTDETANVTEVKSAAFRLSSVTSGKKLQVGWIDKK